MSGFLRSLSAQALGVARSVKSAARLPYAAVPAVVEPAGDGSIAPPGASRIAPTDPPLDTTDEIPAPRNAGIVRDVPSSRVSRLDDDALDQRHAHAMHQHADRNPAMRHHLTVSTPAPLVEPARVPSLPSLVPPAARAARPTAVASASLANPADRHSTNADATEVHVTIGRIDVTAVHEPSTPARRAVRVKNTVPLNEYLARRQQGRS